MDWMTRSDFILLAIAAYVAVMTLVRLMKQRRDVLVADVQRQVRTMQRAKKRKQPSEPDEQSELSDDEDREAA
jgi:hypothetical protein